MDKHETHEADVVIVGAGLSGAMLSYQLAKKGFQVICLEAGPEIKRDAILNSFKEQPDRDFQAPYENTRHAPHPSGRSNDPYLESIGKNEYNVAYLRGVGGTTWHWAGHSWRLLAQDFKEHSLYGVGRDMPISYEDLEPYYYQAELMMGVSGVSDPLDYYNVHRKKPYPLPPLPLSYIDSFVDRKITSLGMRVKVAPSARNTQIYDERPICCGSNNCMPICPIGAQYSASVHIEKARQFKNMKLISNAVVDKIVTTDHKKVDYLRFKDPNGHEHRVHARHYVMAAGGIEIPKLLLMSEVGNDNVGRYLMDHPLMFVSFLAKEDVFPGRGPMVIGSITEHQVGEFRSQRSGFRLNLKNFISMQDISRQYINAGLMGNSLRANIDEHARRLVGMELFFGQLPDRNNRVTLSSQRQDILGIPHPRIDYAVGAWTENSVKPAYEVCESIAKACGLKTDSLNFESEKLGVTKRFNANNHIMGTTIMGDDPRNSATDSFGRVYSRKNDEPMDNLFISSSSLMGATGTSNISLTIAALSLRLANHLENRLQ
jgi:choline dehydrogenase-like flavoprotein